MEKDLKRTGEMLLASGAYGDAFGVPVETKSWNYIAEQYGRLDKLVPTTDNLYFKGTWPKGQTSDDTKGKVDIARALIRADDYDLHAIADEHVRSFLATPDVTIIKNGIKKVKKLGFGTSTSNSMWRIIDGMSPFESGEPGGNGNGVGMKMETLVYWQYVRHIPTAERYRQYDELTNMTHDSDVARVATRVHGDVLYNLLQEYDESEFGDQAWSIAQYHEQELGSINKDVSKNLEFLAYTHEGFNSDALLDEIKAQYADRAEGVSDKEFGRSYGFYVPETLAMTYGAFMIGRGDYLQTVSTAANLGGDADSTASISGAMVNFSRGGEQKMPDDLNDVQDIEQLNALSHQLAAKALRG